jgi:hypothetical protein
MVSNYLLSKLPPAVQNVKDEIVRVESAKQKLKYQKNVCLEIVFLTGGIKLYLSHFITSSGLIPL